MKTEDFFKFNRQRKSFVNDITKFDYDFDLVSKICH